MNTRRRYPMLGTGILVILLLTQPLLGQGVAGVGASAKASEEQPPSAEQLIPQNLLGLVHAPEVQAELKLTPEQQTELLALFGEIDGPWFRARNQPADVQVSTIASLERRVRDWMGRRGTKEQRQRLQQIEVQSLGGTVYVVDQEGYLRHWWQGELNWSGAQGDKVLRDVVNDLLSDPAPEGSAG